MRTHSAIVVHTLHAQYWRRPNGRVPQCQLHHGWGTSRLGHRGSRNQQGSMLWLRTYAGMSALLRHPRSALVHFQSSYHRWPTSLRLLAAPRLAYSVVGQSATRFVS